MAISRRTLLSGAPLLLGAAAGASSQKAPGMAEFEALERKRRARQQALIEPLRKETDRDKLTTRYQAVQATLYQEFAPAFQALAKRHPGTPLQIRATLQAADLCEGVQKKEEADRLIGGMVRACLNLPEMGEATQRIGYMAQLLGEAKIAGYLETIASRSKLTSVQAGAYLAQAQLHYGFNGSGKNPKKGAQLYRLVASKFAGTPYAKQATSALFEVEHLQVGMVAPKISGKDHEDKDFKLSDYRGKVVVLDFWGFW